MAKTFKGRVGERSFGGVRKELQANLRDVRKRVLDEQNAFAVVETAVRQARERINRWTDASNKWRSVGRGVEEVYCLSSDAFREAAAEPSVEKLHEWRKQTKYLRYQLEMLQPLWPERLKELVDEVDEMSRLGATTTDLAVLRQMLDE